MYEMMNEMQTLAFRELEPDAYASITRRLKQLTDQGGDLVNRIGLGLQLYLADNGLEAEVTGRQKHPFSIWKKMAERHISFEQLSDVMAFRVIVGDLGARWPNATSASSNCPTSWRSESSSPTPTNAIAHWA